MKLLAGFLPILLGLLSFLPSQPAFSEDDSLRAACTFQTLNIPGNSAGLATAEAINHSEAIVGTINDANLQGFHAYLLSEGKFFPFMVPHSLRTAAHDINDHAQIVGEFADVSGLHGFLLEPHGFRAIDVPGAGDTIARGINDSGDIVGFYHESTNLGFAVAFLLHRGRFKSFSFPGADPGSTTANSINNHKEIIGNYQLATRNHGFLLKDGIFSSIDFPGASQTQAFKISDDGDIVGTYFLTTGEQHGFVLDNGQYKTIDQPNTSFNTLLGVNSRDQIVGTNQTAFKANCKHVF